MKTIYENIMQDKVQYCNDILTPLVAQFHELSKVKIIGTPAVTGLIFQVIDVDGDAIFTTNAEQSIQQLTLELFSFIEDYNENF